jgi:hypothetical protein
MIDLRAGKPTHVVFCFGGGGKTSPAGKFQILSVGKVDVTLPSPAIGIPVFTEYANEVLVAVRICDSVPRSCFILIIHAGHSSV